MTREASQWQKGRWFPVYYEDLEQHFERVWNDARLYWTWSRLYAIHDRSWPLPGELTRGLSQTAIDELAKLGLVVLMSRHRFTVRGLDARRTAQRTAASNAARTRHGTAAGNAYQTRPESDQKKDGLTTYHAPEIRTASRPMTPAQILGKVAEMAAERKEP